jgi:hypothetical protein
MSFLIAVARAAQTTITDTTIPGMEGLANQSPAGWILSFYKFALTLSGILAFGAIVYGGFLYITSSGNPGKQSDGRAWIQSALLGLLLLASAYVILRTINPDLTQLTVPKLIMPATQTTTSTN